jgi:phosphatidylglycerol:prolipoprotein diacylglycerol transferase
MEEIYGIQVDPALIEQYGNVIPVHPTQLYEVILLTTIFFILWRIREHRHATGWLFACWMVLAGTERFLIEFIRAKSDRYLGIITTSQIVSVILIVLGAYLMHRLAERRAAPEGGEAAPA